jgi:hypothetical protein
MIAQYTGNIQGLKVQFPSIYRGNNMERKAQNLIPVM